MTTEAIEEAMRMTAAIDKAMMCLRYIAGEYQVCPVCFAGAVIEVLKKVQESGEHGETVPFVPIEELRAAMMGDDDEKDLFRDLVEMETKGSA